MDAAELSDLIARAQGREATAFDALVEYYGPRLYGYFYRLLGRRPDAEDLLQDVFVRLVGTIGQYEHDGRFEAWLFRIATNLVRDRIRRARASREFSGPNSAGWSQETWPVDPAERGERSIDRLEKAEELDQLGRAIQSLPEPERMVILLRHFSRLSFREIAELMGTPIGTALARAHRGLGRLRELMIAESTVRPDGGSAPRGH